MRSPDEFDAFYKAARSHLLLQTYALTGDLPAARSAVRDAFVAAWHHWGKVSRLEDPEAWIRPHAWQHAQRRHHTRPWHRDRTLDDDSAATLDSLAKLNLTQRKALLLTQLCRTTLPEMAREIALTDDDAGRALQTAASQFAVHRGVSADAVRGHLEALRPRVGEARFPRPTIIRRAGTARRRTHTGAGLVATVVVLLAAGGLVTQPDGPTTGLGGVSEVAPEPEPEPALRPGDLVRSSEVERLAGARRVTSTRTDANTKGDGINTLCQRERFADPDGTAALVRRFRLDGRPRMRAVQSVELSESARAARRAYRRTVEWYAACQELRVQLLSVHALRGAGNQGMVLGLRSWGEEPGAHTVSVVRSGRLVTTAVRRIDGGKGARLEPMLRLTADALDRLCRHEDGGPCGGKPRAVAAAPPRVFTEPGMLQEVDLPPASGMSMAWVGTRAVRPRQNAAASRCDGADFTVKSVAHATTRSFLVPEAKLPKTFGLTQTVGRFRSPAAARDFVATIRKRMATCEDRDLGTTLDQVHDHQRGSEEMAIWKVATEISDDRVTTFHMALVRRGDTVSQLGFVPVPGRKLDTGDFHWLTDRAAARLPNLPRR